MAKANDFISNKVENIGSTLITITEDKLRNILSKHIPRIRRSMNWIGAVIAMASLAATIYTCEFKDKLWFDASTWRIIFVSFLFLAVYMSVKSIWNALLKNSNEDQIIEEIKTVEGEASQRIRTSCGIRFEKWKVSFFKEKTITK